MAYGRLDVFWPDGKFTTFPLADPIISVGRSSGNTIALETDNISRYHFSLRYQDGQVDIVDMGSANGTYVDGVKLASEQPQPLYGGEEIQIGDLRMIYCDLDETPTRPMLVPEETTRRIELEAPSFRIDVKAPEQGVPPGAHTSAELTITNTGDEAERYSVEVTGLPRDWVRIDRHQLEVAAGETEPVVISFKPARVSESAPGDYAVGVVVRPRSEGLPLKADLTLRVLPFSGFGMALEKRHLSNGTGFRLHLHNQGSAPLPLTVSGYDADKTLQFDIQTPTMTLAPGQRLVVQGDARPRKPRLYGQGRTHTFDLIVRSRDASGFTAATRATVTEQPALPTWAPLAFIAFLAVGVAAVVFGALVLLQPTPPPEITGFTVSSTRVAQGEPVTLNWAAANARDLLVLVNGTPVVEDRGAVTTTGYTLDTTGLEGEVVIAAEAVNGDQRATAVASVFVYQPLQIAYFQVTPTRLMRNVFQPLTLEWDAPGALLTTLAGLDQFTATSIQATPILASYSPSERLSGLVGYASEDLLITLIAQDEAGNQVTQSVAIEVIDPTCEATGTPVSLHRGPGEAHQIIGTAPQGALVSVEAQDSTGEWLQVDLTGVQGWGMRDQFRCDGFDPANLRKEFDVPTPIPTSTATATSTRGPNATATPASTATTRATAQPTGQAGGG